jgi:HAD superfamily hydrolase (TIGR01509 family)
LVQATFKDPSGEICYLTPTMNTLMKSAPNEIRVLLFDVGGVLVQLSGVQIMLEWLGHGISEEELWRRWLQSVPVRQFETGQIDADEFAIAVTSEFGLTVEPRQSLETFTRWPTGLYPGTLEMLARIPSSYQRAVLSNSNALHWPRVQTEMKLGTAFDSQFVSHLTGRIKPDAAAFEHVVESLGCSPASVLFLDDNLLNVDAAQRIGMQAVRVRGIDETKRVLVDLRIIDPD